MYRKPVWGRYSELVDASSKKINKNNYYFDSWGQKEKNTSDILL
jgi:hypothetical protein